jgi:manganese-dependent inorganic pyrophosphatase
MKKIIIIGHTNPDTDSIVSAVIAQDFLAKEFSGAELAACRAGEANNETKFVFKSFGVELPKLVKKITGKESVVLVDFNEMSQAIAGLSFSQVVKVVDHHKIAMTTEAPISCRTEVVGSTSSLLAKMYQETGRKISTKIAKLMLAGILSDTLNLTSPTTTDWDKRMIKELNKIAKLDLKKFVADLFAAKSSLDGISIDTIVNQDYKAFEIGKHKIGVGTWETTNPGSVHEKKEKIMELLRSKKEKDGLEYILFMVVDILKQNCTLYAVDEKEAMFVEKVFKSKAKNGEAFLPGVVSRKKQIIPQITAGLNK